MKITLKLKWKKTFQKHSSRLNISVIHMKLRLNSQRIEPQDMSNGIGRNEWQANRFDSEFRMERISPSFLLEEDWKDRERRNVTSASLLR